MFQELVRFRDNDGGTSIRLYDSCFTIDIADNCNCKAKNCPDTFYHLIKIYEHKSLNISKNLAKYIDWLAGYEWDAYDELRRQSSHIMLYHPEMCYRTKYHHSVMQYMRTKKK
jgi:hypothetical protein